MILEQNILEESNSMCVNISISGVRAQGDPCTATIY
jgi:hypothetical protein